MNKKNLWSLQTLLMVAILSICFVSCSSDDDSDDGITTTSVTLFAGKTKTLEGNVREIVSANEFVATVKDNVITGNHVGETVVTVNGKYKISVSVIPFSNIMNDPVTEWGASKETVKAKQKQGTLSADEDEILVYQNCGDASLVAYSFENGKLSTVLVRMPISKTSSYTDYMMERFAFYPGEFSNYTFLGMDSYSLDNAKTIVGLTIRDINYIIGIYMPIERFNSNESVNTRGLLEFDETRF